MTQEFVTLPRELVERALAALDAEDPYRAAIALRAALEQPQRKLTPQDIADSALLGNIESPFNACMHQEHCKRWKAQAEQHVADHQRESSIDNDLPSENGQLITTSSSVPFGYKLAPAEPTVEMMDAGGAATRRCYQHLNKGEVMCSYVYRHMLAAAPQPPVVEQHTDDAAVNRFAEAMKAKLAVARDKGRGGWDDPAQCTVEYLAKLLVDHIAKGDPIDVANFAMMLHQRQADKSVLSEAAPTPTAVDNPEPAYLLRDLADDISVDALDLIAAIRDAGLGNYSINMMLPARVCVAMCQRFSAVDQDPVAWIENVEGAIGYDTYHEAARKLPDGVRFDLYTHSQNLRCKSNQARLATLWGYEKPQPKRETLTDEQILHYGPGEEGAVWSYEDQLYFARAIEAAHNIK